MIDPIFSYIGDLDPNAYSSAVAVCDRFKAIASAEHIILATIRHLNKAFGAAARYRAGGSIGWQAKPRVALSLGRSALAWTTQLRSTDVWRSRPRAAADIVLPWSRTRRTAPALNSSEKSLRARLGFFAPGSMWDTVSAFHLVSTKADQSQDVIPPGSLPSFVTPEAWEPSRDLARELDDARATSKAIAGKIREVEEAVWLKGSRRVADVSAMADAALRGEVPKEEVPAEPEGLGGLSGQALADLKSGLQRRERESKDRAAWLERRLRAATEDVLKVAAERIAEKYAAAVEEITHLHTLLDATDSILGRGIVPPGWRQETVLAPMVGTMKRIPSGNFSDGGITLLAKYESGAGVPGARTEWAIAVQAATGQTG